MRDFGSAKRILVAANSSLLQSVLPMPHYLCYQWRWFTLGNLNSSNIKEVELKHEAHARSKALVVDLLVYCAVPDNIISFYALVFITNRKRESGVVTGTSPDS